MDKTQVKILQDALDIELSDEKAKIFGKYAGIFLEKNARTNLISKNDEKFLFEKHIFDSLAINKFLKNKKNLKRLLDIGTGGGFPSIPIAILYDDINVFAIDSVGKKIKLLEEIKEELGLKNLFPICGRVENDTQKYDYVTVRAVASLESCLKYAMPKLKSGGYFIAYKSKKALEELKAAEKTVKTSGAKMIDIVEYTLPLEEIYRRNLIIFRK